MKILNVGKNGLCVDLDFLARVFVEHKYFSEEFDDSNDDLNDDLNWYSLLMGIHERLSFNDKEALLDEYKKLSEQSHKDEEGGC